MKLPSLKVNFASLFLMQIANYGIPILIIPFLIKKLGVEEYGSVVLVMSVMALVGYFVEFGLGWGATKDISKNRYNKNRISKIFINAWLIQMIAFLVFVILLVGYCGIKALTVAQTFKYIVAAGMVLGQVLLPIWLFQGLEIVAPLMLIQVSSKIILLPLVFFGVSGTQDGLWVIIYYSSTSIFTGVMSILWIKKNKIICWIKPETRMVIWICRRYYKYALTRFSTAIPAAIFPILIGLISGVSQLSYFNVADKVRLIISNVMAPLSQVVFPRVVLISVENKKEAFILLKRIFCINIIFVMVVGSTLCYFSDQLMILVGGEALLPASNVFRLLVWLPLLSVFSNILGVQMMLPNRMVTEFTLINIIGNILGVLLLSYFLDLNQAMGAAQLLILMEFLIVLLMFIFLHKRRVLSQGKY